MQQNTNASKQKGKTKKTVKKSKAKKKKGMSFNTFVSIFLILLLVAIVLVLYFDVAGSNKILAGILGLENPTQEQLDVLAARELELDTQESELNDKLFTSNQLTDELSDKQSELEAREAAIIKKEEELDAIEDEWDAKENDLASSIGMFELMEAEKAAAAIDVMTDSGAIVRLLISMDSEKAAEILNFMDYNVTGEALDLIMEEPEEPVVEE